MIKKCVLYRCQLFQLVALLVLSDICRGHEQYYIKDNINDILSKLDQIEIHRSIFLKTIQLHTKTQYDYFYIRGPASQQQEASSSSSSSVYLSFYLYNHHKTPQFYSIFQNVDHNSSEYLKDLHHEIKNNRNDFFPPNLYPYSVLSMENTTSISINPTNSINTGADINVNEYIKPTEDMMNIMIRVCDKVYDENVTTLFDLRDFLIESNTKESRIAKIKNKKIHDYMKAKLLNDYDTRSIYVIDINKTELTNYYGYNEEEEAYALVIDNENLDLQRSASKIEMLSSIGKNIHLYKVENGIKDLYWLFNIYEGDNMEKGLTHEELIELSTTIFSLKDNPDEKQMIEEISTSISLIVKSLKEQFSFIPQNSSEFLLTDSLWYEEYTNMLKILGLIQQKASIMIHYIQDFHYEISKGILLSIIADDISSLGEYTMKIKEVLQFGKAFKEMNTMMVMIMNILYNFKFTLIVLLAFIVVLCKWFYKQMYEEKNRKIV